jgi:hypothetical protein
LRWKVFYGIVTRLCGGGKREQGGIQIVMRNFACIYPKICKNYVKIVDKVKIIEYI